MPGTMLIPQFELDSLNDSYQENVGDEFSIRD